MGSWTCICCFYSVCSPAVNLFTYWWRSTDRPADNNHRGKNALAKNWLKIRPTYLRANTCTDFWSCFKGTVAWVGFFVHCILSGIERKDLNFFSFHVVLIFTRLGQDLTHFAHKEITQSENFSVRQAKNLNCILLSYGSDRRRHLTWLKYWPYKVIISGWKILAHSPNTLKEAKVRQN